METDQSPRYRIVLACHGVPAESGPQAAADIAEEFTHRPWHENVQCTYEDSCLLLTAENDYDAQGLALMDEFSDAISACTTADFGYGLRLVSIIAL